MSESKWKVEIKSELLETYPLYHLFHDKAEININHETLKDLTIQIHFLLTLHICTLWRNNIFNLQDTVESSIPAYSSAL